MNGKTGAGLSAMMEACLSVDKPNTTVGPIVLAAVVKIAPRNHSRKSDVTKSSADAGGTREGTKTAAATEHMDTGGSITDAVEFIDSTGERGCRLQEW